MNIVLLANTDFREPTFTLNDVDLARLSVVYKLGA